VGGWWRTGAAQARADLARLRTHKRAVAAAVLLLTALCATLVMQEASALLADAQSEGRSAYQMSTLTYPHWPPWNDDSVVEALNAWQQTGSDGGFLGSVRGWVLLHQTLDFLLFAPALYLLLAWATRRVLGGYAEHPWTIWPPLLYLLSDLSETALTWGIGLWFLRDGQRPEDLHAWLTVPLALLTSLKWVFLLLSLTVIVLGLLSRRRRGIRLWGLLWRLRVQVSAVVVLAVLVALPLKGPFEQIPDMLRSANDNGVLSTAFWLPTLALLVFSALVWSSGRILLLTLYERRDSMRRAAMASKPASPASATSSASALPSTSRSASPSASPSASSSTSTSPSPSPRGPMWRLALVGAAALLVAAVWYYFVDWADPSAGVFAPGTLLLGVFAVDWLVLRLATNLGMAPGDQLVSDRFTPGDLANVRRLRTVVGVLAVLPLAVSGLGAVHAYAPVVLTGGLNGFDARWAAALGWLVLGAVTVVVVTPLAFGALRALEATRPFLGRTVRRDPAYWLTWAGAVALSVVAVLAAVWPATLGSWFEGHGTLTLWLATLTAVAGLVQRRSEQDPPMRFAASLGLHRTPWFGFVIVLLLLVSGFDAGSGYHAMRVQDQQARTVSVQTALDDWYAASSECTVAGQERTVLPLVLVATPGGGARAAYWTSLVMGDLADVDRCGGASLFAASGVSGGSVGLAVWAAAGSDAEQAVTALTGPDALSATVAALLYRDFPRAFTGLHPEGVDRAAVEEDVWIDQVPGLGEDFYAPPESGWKTMLLLNASDLATGCKVVLTRLDLATDRNPDTTGCRSTPHASAEDRVSALAAGAVEGTSFMARDVGCSSTEQGSVTLATAALASARFPYVSPTGRMLRCAVDPVTEQTEVLEELFVADGGYVENTGVHSLLGLWADLQPWVERKNEIPDAPVVVPIAIVIDNHYRSPARSQPQKEPYELTAPPLADRTLLIGSEALEQQLAAAFSGPIVGRAREAGTLLAPADALRWFVVAPTTRPQIAAPLGWTLSQDARDSLSSQVDPALTDPSAACGPKLSGDPALCQLADWLLGRPPRARE
jgi:hypothetical protein